MKNIMIKIFLSVFVVLLATSCSTNTAMNSYGKPFPGVEVTGSKLETNISIGERISGTGDATYLFGWFAMGDTYAVEGVWSGGVTSWFSQDHAKMEATYDALTSSGADMIVDPRYEVTTKSTFLWTTVTAKVNGYKGMIDSFTQYSEPKPENWEQQMQKTHGYAPIEGGAVKVEVDKK